jgi:hypothetical protein
LRFACFPLLSDDHFVAFRHFVPAIGYILSLGFTLPITIYMALILWPRICLNPVVLPQLISKNFSLLLLNHVLTRVVVDSVSVCHSLLHCVFDQLISVFEFSLSSYERLGPHDHYVILTSI